jgi:hypothetical protein
MEQKTFDSYRGCGENFAAGAAEMGQGWYGCWKDTTRVHVDRMVTETLEKIPLNSSKDPPEYSQRSP